MLDRTWLGDAEALDFVSQAGVPIPPYGVARSVSNAVHLAEALPEPFVLKAILPGVHHKSDISGIRTDVARESVADAYGDLMDAIGRHAVGRTSDGVLVQSQVACGTEVIVGIQRDSAFGHVVLFGAGGLLSELVDDVSLRLAPLDRPAARAMIEEARIYDVLRGARGQAVGHIGAVCDIILALSDLVERRPEVVELDLNPVIVHPEGAVAVDALVALHGVRAWQEPEEE